MIATLDILYHILSNDHGEWNTLTLLVYDTLPWLRVTLAPVFARVRV